MLNLKNKKVLLVGLGRLGGGLATAKFLVKNKARVTITDLKTKEELAETLKKLKGLPIKFVLGQHREVDFKNNDIVVFNPAVPFHSPWIKLAKKLGKEIDNDLTLFLKTLDPADQYIGITGTRGKTTTATWTAHFLGSPLLGGNIRDRGLLGILKNKTDRPIVLELSSFQLEFMKKGLKPPRVAVITNISPDHLNRHKGLSDYVRIKSNIFMNQGKGDFLILNGDNQFSKRYLKMKPKGKIFFTSLNPLSPKQDGLYFKGSDIYFQEGNKQKKILTKNLVAEHLKYNLLASLLAAYIFVEKFDPIKKRISNLPEVKFREEVILKKKNLTVINDSAATSPEGTIAAIKRFSRPNREVLLITGGTNKNLQFIDLAHEIKKNITNNNIFFLDGSATRELIYNLKKIVYFREDPQIFQDLGNILRAIKSKVESLGRPVTIIFSPGSASFEKFKHEFDRGDKFNRLVRQILR